MTGRQFHRSPKVVNTLQRKHEKNMTLGCGITQVEVCFFISPFAVFLDQSPPYWIEAEQFQGKRKIKTGDGL
jgi:hypothetical protein